MDSSFRLPFRSGVVPPAASAFRRIAGGVLTIVLAGFAAQSPAAAESITFTSGESRVSLLELYTSEGCSSCPPADAWLSQLKSSPDLWRSVVPVAFHVDYWNRLGWPDRFSSADSTNRQRRYAAEWQGNSVYTPGFVLNGQEWRGFFDRASLTPGAGNRAGRLTVTLRDRTTAEVSFVPTAATRGSLRVEIALLGADLESDVKRGENGGRKLHHDFVVLHLGRAALTESGGRYSATITVPEALAARPAALAAWVSSTDAQTPLQATGGWLTKR